MDVVVPITGGAVALTAGFLGKQIYFAVRAKVRRWDSHIDECAQKAVDHARLEEKVNYLTSNQSEINRKLDRILETRQ